MRNRRPRFISPRRVNRRISETMGRRRAVICAALLIMLAAVFSAGSAGAEVAENITSGCKFKVCAKPGRTAYLTDNRYTTYWESEKEAHPWITVSTEKPAYGLYLCFQNMPDGYVIQQDKDGTWELDGDVLKLDISTELAGGRIFSYTAECTKTE